MTGTETETGPEREQWNSRMGFIFASVGAAVGFGNIWRFPALAYEYGGGAFFIPYLLALIFIGIPLLILEIALGQYYRTGDIGVFGGIHYRLRGIGVSSVLCGFSVVLYYIPLIAWTAHAFFASFNDFDKNYKDSSGSNAYDYFKNDIIGMSTLAGDNLPTRLMWKNVGCLFFVYSILFLCVGFGLKNTGRIAYFTMGFPILLLFIFLIRGVTLEGSSDGIKAYIGEWDLAVLTDKPEVWSTAVSQIFFSIGVTFGIFTAYGSACPKNAPIISNSIIIALANTFFSFISGFAVFAALGYLANMEGVPVADVADSGPGLVFGTYPVVLSGLPGGEHWVRLFFVFLFLLGIDSGFGLFEAVLIVLYDSTLGDRFSKSTIAGVLCVIGFLIGLIFVTDAGFVFLDVVDFYVNFILIFVGFLEVFGAGWIFGIEDQVSKIGKAPVLLHIFTTYASLIFASGFWFGLESNAVLGGFLALIVSYCAGMALVAFLCVKVAKEKNMSIGNVFYILLMENVITLKDRIFTNVEDVGKTFLPAWAFVIKHMMGPVLAMCFINLCVTKTKSGKPTFGHYGGLVNWPYQIMGIFIVVLTVVIFLLGVAIPSSYDSVVKPEIAESVQKLNSTAGKDISQDEVEKPEPKGEEMLPEEEC